MMIAVEGAQEKDASIGLDSLPLNRGAERQVGQIFHRRRRSEVEEAALLLLRPTGNDYDHGDPIGASDHFQSGWHSKSGSIIMKLLGELDWTLHRVCSPKNITFGHLY